MFSPALGSERTVLPQSRHCNATVMTPLDKVRRRFSVRTCWQGSIINHQATMFPWAFLGNGFPDMEMPVVGCFWLGM